jgi:hypothetical protein
MDVCAGGTTTGGSVTFENHHNEACTLTGLGSLLSCGSSFVVPAKGSLTCNVLSNAAKGSYPYTASCCGKKRTNPAIIYS